MRLRLTVIGSSARLNREVERMAEEVGREVARAGAVLITGGRGGVMEAVCRGARAEGGLTVGILPGDSPIEANPHVDLAINTGIGYARNYINITTADAVISIAGAGGTLSEIGYALALNKPLILLKGTGGVTDLLAATPIPATTSTVETAETPTQAVKLAVRMAKTVGS